MNEKLRILKMIESGQISAAEAARLLQAVDSGVGSAPRPPIPPIPHVPPRSEPHSHARHDERSNNGRPSGERSSDWDEIGKKFESFARDVAPKVERFAEVVADKIAVAADRVSDALTSEGAPPPHGQSRAPAPKRPSHSGGFVEKQIEMAVETGGYNELSLTGMNGDVRIKGYNGDKISARLVYRAKKAKANIELVKLGGKYFLKYEPDEFEMVSIDAFVPERAFSVVKIDGMNGQLDASSLSASEMRFSNANGDVSLAGLAAGNFSAESSNGRFFVSNIAAETATIENMNGVMETSELDISKLKLSNYNGLLSVVMTKFARHAEYVWSVETGNAKLDINLPTLPEIGYHIKAHAAMSEIRLGLTGLQYLINEPSLVEARSVSFDRAAKKIKLAVETSNAPLLIN